MPVTIQHQLVATTPDNTTAERKRASNRASYLRNREVVNARSIARQQRLRAENPDSVRARLRQWHAKNMARINSKKRARRAQLKAAGKPEKQYRNAQRDHEYYVKNRDAWRAYYRTWSAKNLDKEAARVARRRAGIGRATPRWADLDAIREIYSQARQLSESTGVEHHVDHIVPLNGTNVSGLHWHINLQILTGSANLKKGNQLCQ